MQNLVFLLVVQSQALADEVIALARTLAPTVRMQACECAAVNLNEAAKLISGRIDEIVKARGNDVQILALTDVGSSAVALAQVHTKLESGRLYHLHAPFLEGFLSAAVAAQQQQEIAAILRAGEGAALGFNIDTGSASAVAAARSQTQKREFIIARADGLDARAAAQIAHVVSSVDAEVELNGTAADSVLALMRLRLEKGAHVRLEANGRAALEAAERVGAILESTA